MAIFNYTLPSGAQFQLTAPTGTTQIQADNIFYSQVAAGTFVGYNKGDTLTHPMQALTNFGITRLQRGTAGVDDKTLLAIISGLPIVATLPSLAVVPVQNPIDQTSYIKITNTPTGAVNLSLKSGQLSSQQTQALMAQMASLTGNMPTTFSQENGIGMYGFNCTQLEQAGLIKPGMSQLYCPINENTGENPTNFVTFMNSPTPWTGLYGVTSVNDILNDQGLQNQIQERLLQQSYDQLVSTGIIVPPKPSVTTPSVSTGQIYSTNGALVSTSILALLATGPNDATALQTTFLNTLGTSGSTTNNLFSGLTPTSIGSIPSSIQNLGSAAVASYTSGLSSISSGAVGFVTNGINSNISQISGLASGLTGGSISSLTSSIASSVNGDVGALMAVGSKYGTQIASTWASGAGSLASLGTDLTSGMGSSIGSLTSGIGSSIGSLTSGISSSLGSLTSGIDSLAKASLSSINFSDFSLSSLISKVQPAAAFSNTVNRATVDAAVDRIIGSSLITPPTYELPSINSLGTIADISSAKNLLSQAQSIAQGIGNKIVNIL
jgi:hypothetical protein